MAQQKPDPRRPAKDTIPPGDKRGGYSGAEDAASVPPPERVGSAYLPATGKSR